MKSINELKKEQCELKDKLIELVEFINSEEYYTLSPIEKQRIGQQRSGMEMYLNALTNRVYGGDFSFDSSTAMLPLLMSMFSSNSFGSTSGLDSLKASLDSTDAHELKEEGGI